MSDTSKSSLPYRPCVGVMLLNAQGLVWAGLRSDRKDQTEGKGHWWQMPQGGIDPGEEPEEAAKRELFEETGVTSASFIAETRDWLTYDLPSELVGIAWKGKYCGQRQKWFAARFEGEESEIDLAARVGHDPEFESWKWVEMASLPELIVPFKRHVYSQVVSEFLPLVEQTRS